jgi:hypothetical protein
MLRGLRGLLLEPQKVDCDVEGLLPVELVALVQVVLEKEKRCRQRFISVIRAIFPAISLS